MHKHRFQVICTYIYIILICVDCMHFKPYNENPGNMTTFGSKKHGFDIIWVRLHALASVNLRRIKSHTVIEKTVLFKMWYYIWSCLDEGFDCTSTPALSKSPWGRY